MHTLPCGGRNCDSKMMRGGPPLPVTCAMIATPSTPHAARVLRRLPLAQLPLRIPPLHHDEPGHLAVSADMHVASRRAAHAKSMVALPLPASQVKLSYQDLLESKPAKARRTEVASANNLGHCQARCSVACKSWLNVVTR